MRQYKKLSGSIVVFILVSTTLILVQLKVEYPMILLERFVKGSGWFEIIIIASYGSVVFYKMQDSKNVQKWRRITWMIFSFVFFSQLIIGLVGNERFLMTGKLHLPIPMMMLSGPIYRGNISFMTMLFLSTIVITGSAWCSHLCYFGAVDNVVAKGKTKKVPIKHKWQIKATIAGMVILITIILRWLQIPTKVATYIAGAYGVAGVIVIIVLSGMKRKMIHCTVYCPIGTIVNGLRLINPFRMYIDNDCDQCMKCTMFCKYDALKTSDITRKIPGSTCTLCGDCVSTCPSSSIKYKFFSLLPGASRNLYLILTISIHAIFMALARI